MALIAFCAMALVENVTNAHPVRREGGGEEAGMEGQWKGAGQRGRRRRRRGRQERTKTRQKGWTHRCYKKKETKKKKKQPKTEIDTENISQADNSVLSRCGNNSWKMSTVS